MSENKHTPGPWRVKGATIWGNSGPLAVVQGPPQPTMDGAHIEPEANRRLIAAAPTMLEALEDVCNWCGQENLKTGEIAYQVGKDCKDCRVAAAIKAAKGEA